MEETLLHYGIKGMKWGVRRTPEQLGHARDPKKRKGSADDDRVERRRKNLKTAKSLAKGAAGVAAAAGGIYTVAALKKTASDKSEARTLSDDELKARNTRMTLEKKYKSLKKETTPSKVEIVGDIAEQANKSLKQAKDWNDKAIARERKKEKLDLSSMSDQELRSAITRAQLEKQYHDFYARDEQISSGRQYLSDVIDTAAPIISLAGTAVSVAVGIKALKGK